MNNNVAAHTLAISCFLVAAKLHLFSSMWAYIKTSAKWCKPENYTGLNTIFARLPDSAWKSEEDQTEPFSEWESCYQADFTGQPSEIASPSHKGVKGLNQNPACAKYPDPTLIRNPFGFGLGFFLFFNHVGLRFLTTKFIPSQCEVSPKFFGA